MKVSVLTQPLGRNYGGLLQAYALQVALRKLGCSVETLDRRKAVPAKVRPKSRFKHLIKKMLVPFGVMGARTARRSRYEKLQEFRDSFVSLSPLIDSDEKLLSYYSINNFDALIVGSDQVWRPRYSPKLSNFFFDFFDELDLKAKRVAYAASYGVDHKEFSVEDLASCRPLAKQFDAISVREHSGILLTKEYFDMPAELVLDPTLLLDCEDYESVILRDGGEGSNGSRGVLAYFLDIDDKKRDFVNKVAGIVGESPYYLMSAPPDSSGDGAVELRPYPRVGDWLDGFRAAEFVVTDSFHGCIFAIIFNKPFLVVGNAQRGLARFASLLKMLGLEDRLVDSVKTIDQSLVLGAINWDEVNNIKNHHREKSIEFIKSSLSI